MRTSRTRRAKPPHNPGQGKGFNTANTRLNPPGRAKRARRLRAQYPS